MIVHDNFSFLAFHPIFFSPRKQSLRVTWFPRKKMPGSLALRGSLALLGFFSVIFTYNLAQLS